MIELESTEPDLSLATFLWCDLWAVSVGGEAGEMLWNIVCALLTGDPVTRGQLSRLISSISVNNFPLAFTIMKLKSRIPRYGTLDQE